MSRRMDAPRGSALPRCAKSRPPGGLLPEGQSECRAAAKCAKNPAHFELFPHNPDRVFHIRRRTGELRCAEKNDARFLLVALLLEGIVRLIQDQIAALVPPFPRSSLSRDLFEVRALWKALAAVYGACEYAQNEPAGTRFAVG